MKRIAAATATLALGVTLSTGIAQAQEPGRYGTALRPVAPASASAHNDGRDWKDSRRDDRGLGRSQRERVRDRNDDRDRVYDRGDGRYEDDRTWGKSAIIVGGSAATGAGIGGILGGAKGALIGAAIGGGGAAIYEGTKQR